MSGAAVPTAGHGDEQDQVLGAPSGDGLSGTALARSREAEVRQRFIDDTAEHTMEVMLDEGLHRHLRFKKPGTSAYYFDLVTWPGYLAIVGDCGEYVFSRTRDMFDFFSPSGARGGFEDERYGINPQYWAEKLRAPGMEGASTYSHTEFVAHVREWAEYIAEDLDADDKAALRLALNEQVLDDHLGSSHDEHQARQLLNEFEWRGYAFHDAWEWHLREYRHDFLWACWAVVWGIERYRAAAETSGGTPFDGSAVVPESASKPSCSAGNE